MKTFWLRFELACMCVLTTSHWTASVMRVSTKLALPRHSAFTLQLEKTKLLG